MYQILRFYCSVLLGDCNLDLVFPKVFFLYINVIDVHQISVAQMMRKLLLNVNNLTGVVIPEISQISYIQLCPGLITGEISAGYLFKTYGVSSVLPNCMDTEITSIYCLQPTMMV